MNQFQNKSFENACTMVAITHISSAILLLKLPDNKVLLWFVIIAIFDLLILAIYIIKKKKTAKIAAVNPTLTAENKNGDNPNLPTQESDSKLINSIFLFGNFQFYINEIELSSKFSPLLKELFLLIFLHSTNKNRGITSNNIIEKLWPDMADKNARNNLAVNIGKLRGILGAEFHELLTNQSGNWKFEMPENEETLYCDYSNCLRLIQSQKEYSFPEISNLVNIVQKGGLLVDLSYEWLDPFKANISNDIIDTLLSFVLKNSANISANLAIQIADTIMLLDMANENAMELKCKALVSLGKHSLANETYLKFIKEFKTLYCIEFQRDFKSIIS